jgi:mannose-6-phosphate isomerase-like protein (cupin superfamily)
LEQVYAITAGSGSILAGEEERQVGPGELVYVPSGTIHGIENSQKRCSPTSLVAISVLDAQAAYDDRGQLQYEECTRGVRVADKNVEERRLSLE